VAKTEGSVAIAAAAAAGAGALNPRPENLKTNNVPKFLNKYSHIRKPDTRPWAKIPI